jgi:hypothetical protein
MRVLLTGARAPATLELARLCARAGHHVHVADTHRWHICRGSRAISGSHTLPSPRFAPEAYADAVRRLVERAAIDVVVPTCEEVFHLAAIRDTIGARVVCEPLRVLAPLHDKWRFIAASRAAQLSTPRTHLLTTTRDLQALPRGRYIIKPRYSRFATDVVAWQTGSALPEHRVAADVALIAQEELTGPTYCSWSVAQLGAVHAHATYAVDATAGPRGAAIAFHTVRHAGVLQWVQRFIAHHHLSGQFAFDFIETVAGVMAIECNPRLTSGVHCFRDMPDIVRAMLDSTAPVPQTPVEPAVGRAFRSRLALMLYGGPVTSGAGLLDSTDDPWPRRIQVVSWVHAMGSAALMGTTPRR